MSEAAYWAHFPVPGHFGLPAQRMITAGPLTKAYRLLTEAAVNIEMCDEAECFFFGDGSMITVTLIEDDEFSGPDFDVRIFEAVP